MTERKRIMIFFDHNNIFREFLKLNKKFDYIKLRDLIIGDRNLVASHTFMGIKPAKDSVTKFKKKKFFELLRKNQINPITAIVKIRPDKTIKEKEIDIALATEMLSSAFQNKYDIAVLVSGDGDYAPVIKKILSLNKSVEIWTFKKALSYRLTKIIPTQNINYLDAHLDKIELR